MVRATLVVSVAHRARSCARGFRGALPATITATTNGGRAGRESVECADGAAAGPTAVVRDALVVPAGRRGPAASVDDTRPDRGAVRHDAASAGDTAGFDTATAPGGHVFCLTAPVMMVAWAMRLAVPHHLA
jgi:hypothetical protein